MSETRTLISALVGANASGEDPGFASFFATASSNEVRLAYMLACVIVLPEEKAIRIAERVWPDFEASALDAILERPFVERVHGGVRLTDRWAQALSARFRETRRTEFREVHQHLADSENTSLAAEENPENRWFIRGRTAFYLAGIDPRQSVEEFGEVFTTPPVVERTARRLWLSALVERQRPLLSGAEREVAFFRGFSHYVLGRRTLARSDFELVVSTHHRDRFRAVALHLLGSMQRGRDDGFAMVRESVALSSHLGITENEVMARHTLSWVVAVRAQSARSHERAHLIDESFGLARLNAERAEATGDEYLIAWCSRTAAAIEWLRLTTFRTVVDDEARARARPLIDALHKASHLALTIGEIETASLAANDAVAMWRDIGAIDAAVAEAAEFLDNLGPLRAPPNALGNFAKTLGSIQPLLADAAQADELRSLRARVDRIAGQRPRRRGGGRHRRN